MSTDLAEGRKGRALTMALIAAGFAATAAVTIAIDARSSRPDLASGPVLANLAQNIESAQRITVTSADATYRIERVQHGAERVWVMRDRGDYPVLASRLSQLSEGLEHLQYVRRMTTDAARHERLGVTDPRHGGRGVLVQIEGARGAFLVNLIVGVEQSGTYVRKPDENQVWAVRGELPPLRNVASWLNLAPLDLEASKIARVDITPPSGPVYSVARAGAEDPEFAIVGGRSSAFAASSVTATGERLAALSPIDVQPAPAITGAPAGHVRAITFDGVVIDGELVVSDNKTWLKLVAHPADAAPNPAQEQAALAINNRAAGWAYALAQSDLDVLAPPLNAFMPPPAPTIPNQ